MRCKSLKVCSIVGILGVLLALSLVLWMGCESDVPSKPEAADETTVYGAPPQNVIDRVMAIQDRHTPRLMAIPGVVGTATGLGSSGQPAILVLAEKPGVAGIPGLLDGVPVIPKVTGEIRALGKPDRPEGKPPKPEPEPSVNPTAWFPRPVPMGVSTGHPDITAGTIGCRVKDAAGNVYALSNNHVYANENRASIGDPVLQPGAFDEGSAPGGVIGNLFDFEPIDFNGGENTIDAAIASSSTELLGNATPSDGYGTPKSTTVPATIGLKVQKYGRTTGLTTGTVDAINATVKVGYDSGVALFTNQIVITPGTFSAGGDSGSLIVVAEERRGKRVIENPDSHKPVGLLFAGSTAVTIANPIDPVLEAFSVTIDGE